MNKCYNSIGNSLQELMCRFTQKINECVDVSIDTYKLAEWLKNEGLDQEVSEKIDEMIKDGTIENILNDKMFKKILEKFTNDIDIIKVEVGKKADKESTENTISTLATKSELEVERQRINKLSKLGEGSTTGDRELQDIRVGYDGVTYDSAGESVRHQSKRLMNNITEVSKGFIPLPISLLGRGGYNKEGLYDQSMTYAITNEHLLNADRDTLIKVNEGYQFFICLFKDGVKNRESGLVTSYFVPKGYQYRVMVQSYPSQYQRLSDEQVFQYTNNILMTTEYYENQYNINEKVKNFNYKLFKHGTFYNGKVITSNDSRIITEDVLYAESDIKIEVYKECMLSIISYADDGSLILAGPWIYVDTTIPKGTYFRLLLGDKQNKLRDFKEADYSLYRMFNIVGGVSKPFKPKSEELNSLPQYYKAEIKRVKDKLMGLDPTNFNMIVYTDVHNSYESFTPVMLGNMMKSIKEISNTGNIDAVACLGDLIEGGGQVDKSTSIKQMREVINSTEGINKPILWAFGNHDNNAYNYGSYDWTKDNFILTNEYINTCPRVFGYNKDYYYIDLKDKRIIVTNGSQYAESIQEDGSIKITGHRDAVIQQSQLKEISNWMKTTDKDIIILSHTILQELFDLIKAFNSKGSYLGIQFNEVRNKIVLHSTGHWHNNALEYLEEYKAPCLSTNTSCMAYAQQSIVRKDRYPMLKTWEQWDNGGEDKKVYPRTHGTINECSFDIISVGKNSLERIKFGAGIDKKIKY